MRRVPVSASPKQDVVSNNRNGVPRSRNIKTKSPHLVNSKVFFAVAFFVVFWISISIHVLRLEPDKEANHDVLSSVFHLDHHQDTMLRHEEEHKQKENPHKEQKHGLLEQWAKQKEKLEKNPGQNPLIRKEEEHRNVRIDRQGGRLNPRANLEVHVDRQKAAEEAWSKKRVFQQRVGGYRQPKVRVPSNVQHAKHVSQQIQFHGYNTTAKELDMRNLNYELPFDNPDGGAWKQGWDIENTHKRPLTIYVLPHSHCDPGWIKTFDAYFQEQTKKIISSVIHALQQDEKRKFVWAEISYFEWWWREQTPEVQEATRKLLKSGQLEFVTGGWVQPDEANTQLYAMEIQLQEGHDWIRATFGEEYIPKYGWSIDPFGYSPTMAYLLKKYNFEAMLIQRVHYAIKKELASRQHLEFYWRQTWDKGPPDERQQHDIFTHVMPFFSYDVPHTCGPDPSVCCQFDFARQPMPGAQAQSCPWGQPPLEITERNVRKRAMLLLDQYEKKAALYRSNVVLIPLGDDFRYKTVAEAENQYRNYQKMFDYINANVDDVTIQFGTLSEYFKKAKETYHGNVPTLKGSFFTYADIDEDYWSGYFTSRIFDKALDRKLERVLYAASTMGATKEEMQEPRRALSLFQHHDGVTGTAKNHVVQDYADRIHKSINSVQDYMIQYIQKQYRNDDDAKSIQACWKSDAPRGLSQNLCASTTRDDKSKVYLFNPLNTSQSCGTVEVEGHKTAVATLPCEVPGPLPLSKSGITFDARTGLMTHPISEHWMVWNVEKGGAYLFHPGTLSSFDSDELVVSSGGYVVSTPNWKRRVIERQVPSDLVGDTKTTVTVLDFVFETDLETPNEEWVVRFAGDIQNDGVFHTDLNGFNFATHQFRDDMPIQSQVFPMPTLASIQDDTFRMTVLSEHAQGTASLLDGTIDVWLDRRLKQDDGRGLGQGVTDNVPTRTRLRVVLENDGFDNLNGVHDYQPTPVCRRMWDELNHPLEMFGQHKFPSASDAAQQAAQDVDAEEQVDSALIGQYDLLPGESLFDELHDIVLKDDEKTNEDTANRQGMVVPFVIMVYKRVDYLQKAIDSLRNSDFNKNKIPLIVSMDGHVPEMTEYVESLRLEFQLTVLIHPHSCHDHPDTFPGQDESLNTNYDGDAYGNKRSAWVTCAKHHFTWMLRAVFGLDSMSHADHFLFLEEDYVVAPTVYESVENGLYLLEQLSDHHRDFFGVCLDPTEGYLRKVPYREREGWTTSVFKSGPMTLSRQMYKRIQNQAKEYCTFDDYNWDWTIVHLQGRNLLPAQIIEPSVPQALHIGAEAGMHNGGGGNGLRKRAMSLRTSAPEFHGTKLFKSPSFFSVAQTHDFGFGGWGHPADQEHCLEIMTTNA